MEATRPHRTPSPARAGSPTVCSLARLARSHRIASQKTEQERKRVSVVGGMYNIDITSLTPLRIASTSSSLPHSPTLAVVPFAPPRPRPRPCLAPPPPPSSSSSALMYTKHSHRRREKKSMVYTHVRPPTRPRKQKEKSHTTHPPIFSPPPVSKAGHPSRRCAPRKHLIREEGGREGERK